MRRSTLAGTAQRLLRCALYGRKSNEEGLDQAFNSLDSQRFHCEKYVEGVLVGTAMCLPTRYDDGGWSGKDTNRPAMRQMMRDIEAGLIDCVVVYRLDRLTRSLKDLLQLLEMFAEHNVAFISVTERFDTSGPYGMLVMQLMAIIAEYERKMTSERIKDKLQASKASGRYTSDVVIGYDRDPETREIVINEVEAEIIRFLFQRFIETRSMALVAREANERGYQTKRKLRHNGNVLEAREIRDTDLHKWLRNCVYVGQVRDIKRGITFPGRHQAIVTQEVWDRVQEIFEESLPQRLSRSRQRTPGFLRGLVHCGHCHCHMRPSYASSGKKHRAAYRYYLCTSAARLGYKTCPMAIVPAGKLEDYALEKLHTVVQQPEIYAESWRLAQLQFTEQLQDSDRRGRHLTSELEELRVELAGAKEGLTPAGRPVMDVQLHIINLDDELQRLLERQRELRALSLSEGELVKTLHRVETLWELLSENERNRLCHRVFARIEVSQDQIEVELRQTGLSSLAREIELAAAH